ncbi:hypothetical protein N867_05030, partial [Actinotalea fermentans ATCC 43279 = JCM 9966 = DSM 3133]
PAAFARADLDAAALRLATLLRERRPDVVVTYEPGGGYGHPDHVRAHEVTMRALALAGTATPSGLPIAPVVLWAAVDAAELATAVDELTALLRDGGDAPGDLHLPGPDREAPSVAVPSEAVALRVDVRPVLDAVVGALQAHATQVQAIRTWPVATGASIGCLALSDGVRQPLLCQESYRLAAGDATRVAWPDGITR